MTAAPHARLLRVSSGEKFPLFGPSFHIGRDPDCALRLLDPHVSRIHAEIRREGEDYVVYDLSTNGTFVNAVRVEGSRKLAHGDMIRVASENLVFMTLPGASEELAAAAKAAAFTAPPQRPPSTGGTDPGLRTAFFQRPKARRIPVWVYIGAAVVIAVALFVLFLLLIGP